MSKNKEKSKELTDLANCIRFLAIDAVQKAKSGHPGMPMGMADIATVIFKDHLKFDPNNPDWIDRDRLIISNGHGSMLLYACLYLSGYKDINLKNIKNFRQLNSPTAGHPEYGDIKGIETTTGPLSQGLANGVGFAIAEKILQSNFGKKFVDHYTYVFAGDGCLMEGLSHEACSLAGHLKLSNLIVLFDDNLISIDGSTKLSTSDDVIKRFKSYNWNTISINGHNHLEISKAIVKAKESKLPTIIACKTKIGFGSPNKEAKSSSHGSPLGEDEIILTRKKLNWPHKAFLIPKKLSDKWNNFYKRNNTNISIWKKNSKKIINSKNYQIFFDNPKLKKLDKDIFNFKLYHIKNQTNCATRKASELSLEVFAEHYKNLIGGSADLTGSNNTKVKNMQILSKENFKSQYIHYGVREHAMAAIMNGLALHGGIKPYGGTFLVFSDYCRPSIRLAALMKIPVIYVMTHDSIGLGEDGPTHQPVEHLAALRAIPNLNVIRPCDIIETIEAWEVALKSQNNPTAIILTRQNMPILRKKYKKNLLSNGAYAIIDFKKYHGTILATGSEVEIAIKASNELRKDKIFIRVVSFPSWEIFFQRSKKYKDNILGIKPKFAIEAGIIHGWENFVNPKNFIGMKSYGKSGPYKKLYEHFGITYKSLIKMIKDRI